jgi:hypothetical protein
VKAFFPTRPLDLGQSAHPSAVVHRRVRPSKPFPRQGPILRRDSKSCRHWHPRCRDRPSCEECLRRPAFTDERDAVVNWARKAQRTGMLFSRPNRSHSSARFHICSGSQRRSNAPIRSSAPNRRRTGERAALHAQLLHRSVAPPGRVSEHPGYDRGEGAHRRLGSWFIRSARWRCFSPS